MQFVLHYMDYGESALPNQEQSVSFPYSPCKSKA